MPKLIIARHHESEWNKLGQWTGIRDRHLTEYGFKKSSEMGLLLKDIPIDAAFASMQVRTIETLSCILETLNLLHVPTIHSSALNERDYGDYTGKNKWDMQKLLGEEEWSLVRREWNYPVPNGETLAMVYERVLPCYLSSIVPLLNEGKNVLVVAHGNSLRALTKYIESIPVEEVSNLEIEFGAVVIYDVDKEGRMLHKEMRHSKAQIIATLGPSSDNPATLRSMMEHNLDVVRLNFSWGEVNERKAQISLVRELAKEQGRHIPIIIDLPGPRIQKKDSHNYDHHTFSAITEHDKQFIQFASEMDVEYLAVSFVGGPKDIDECRKIIASCSGKQKIIAKIEREVAVQLIDEIIEVTDAIMVARGDLGNEIPLEKIPFVEDLIIQKAKKAGKPVIVATQMLLSMTHEPVPTRAEVTDVTYAILQGADVVMLSEETAIGAYPVEAVTMMEKVVIEAELHRTKEHIFNLL